MIRSVILMGYTIQRSSSSCMTISRKVAPPTQDSSSVMISLSGYDLCQSIKPGDFWIVKSVPSVSAEQDIMVDHWIMKYTSP